jgi:hypothetical protein
LKLFASIFNLRHAPNMASEKPRRKFLVSEDGSDAERLWRLMEWAELINKDLGAFIGALDRFYMEKQSAGKPPTMDFLSAANSNKE